MKFFEIIDPYYALLKAKTKEDAVTKYIEFVTGDKSEFNELLKECKVVPEYYAAAKFAQSKGEKGDLPTLKVVTEVFSSNESEVLIMDGSLL